jgi:hypothetical protein
MLEEINEKIGVEQSYSSFKGFTIEKISRSNHH